MEDLTLTLIQTTLFWEDKERNFDHMAGLMEKVNSPTDLILLPEMFNTGFVMNPGRYAEDPDGPSMEFLRQMARARNAAVATTLMMKEKNGYVNRLVVVFPDGKSIAYDKRHLFRLSNEFQYFLQGEQQVIFSLKGWKLMPMVCYDLRFPVWSRNQLNDGEYAYDLLIYVANWPVVRSSVWKHLLVARAIENMAYVAGINRVGPDGNGMDHTGDSMVVDPKGEILYQAPERQEIIQSIVLNAQDMHLFRESFAFGLDWDAFSLG